MIPNFALNLSEDGITLLQRAPNGSSWLERHFVSLDSDTLEGDLHKLRNKAVEIEGENFTTTLILPASQLLYTVVEVGDDPKADIVRALQDLTPYQEDQIVFDQSGDGPKVQVVAVAKETLEEAENFLAPFRLNPISFTATPEPDQFEGEPKLGTPAKPPQIAPKDNSPEAEAKADPKAASPADPQTAPQVESPKAETQVEKQVVAPKPEKQPELDLAPKPDTKDLTKGADLDAKPATPQAKPEKPAPAPAPAAAQTPSVSTRPVSAKIGSEKKPEAPAGNSTLPKPITGPAEPSQKAPPQTAPSQKVTAQKTTAKKEKATNLVIEEKPSEPAPKLGGARRPNFKPKVRTNHRAEPKLTKPKTAAAKPIVGAAEKRPGADGSKSEKSTPANSGSLAELAVKKVGGKPRFLGVVLTAMLLLALGLLVLVSSYFPASSPIADIFDEPIQQNTELQSAELQNTGPQSTEAERDEVTVMSEMDLASLPANIETPDFALPNAPGLAAPAPQFEGPTAPIVTTEPATPLTENEARTIYAATGIWQLAPTLDGQWDGDNLDDLYVASLDPKVAFEDAPALHRYEPYSTDTDAQAHAAPVPPGTVFDLDERGLVRATPEGAVNPDGVMVFAGQPPVTTAPRPEDLAVQAPATDVPNRLAEIHPLERPGDLVETQERATLGGLAKSELAEIRPTQRPINLQQRQSAIERALAEASTSGDLTDADAASGEQLAVVATLRPSLRPKGFDKLVAASRRAHASVSPPAASPSTAQPSSGAPAVARPSAPTRHSVARAATQNDIVALGQVSLIGVTGSPSNRRALVRMPNGRIKRVTVGDRLNGGRVRAIGEDVLKYTKGSRTLTLAMPRG